MTQLSSLTDTASTGLSTLSLHDALPILLGIGTDFESVRDYAPDDDVRQVNWRATARVGRPMSNQYRIDQDRDRSEEHTSELQSRRDLVCRLLLEKKNKR